MSGVGERETLVKIKSLETFQTAGVSTFSLFARNSRRKGDISSFSRFDDPQKLVRHLI